MCQVRITCPTLHDPVFLKTMDLYLLDDSHNGFLLCTQIDVDKEQNLIFYHNAVELLIRPTREQAEFI